MNARLIQARAEIEAILVKHEILKAVATPMGQAPGEPG
jgi:hypothetical protein